MKGGDPQDTVQHPAGRGRGQPYKRGQQTQRPPKLLQLLQHQLNKHLSLQQQEVEEEVEQM